MASLSFTYTLNELNQSSSSSTPEPSTIVLMGLGIAALTLASSPQSLRSTLLAGLRTSSPD